MTLVVASIAVMALNAFVGACRSPSWCS